MRAGSRQVGHSVSRRSFLGAAATTLTACGVAAPYALAQSAAETSKDTNDPPTGTGDGMLPLGKDGPHSSRHITSLNRKPPYFIGNSGSLACIDTNDLHRLKGLSIRRLVLTPRGVREPHWYANAHELGHCLRGEHLITIAGDHNTRNSFTVSAGEAFFVPSGALHHIENIGTEEGEIILGLSHEQPEEFGLSGTFGCFTDAVLGNTIGLPAAAFADLKRTPQDTLIGSQRNATAVELEDRETNPYKYSLGGALPQVSSAAGSVHAAQSNVWPILQDLAIFSLTLTDQGMRGLHWHPETAEMGYILEGKGRMTIVSPGGTADTFAMNPGDVYFIPKAYPHHFEDIGKGDLRLLVFFDQVRPGDIGMRTAVSCFSHDVLAAAFKVDPAKLPHFPFTAHDPLLVPRVNPVDSSGPI